MLDVFITSRVRRKIIEVKAFPVRESRDRQCLVSKEKADLFVQQFGRLHVRCDHHQQTFDLPYNTGDGQRQAVATQPAPDLPGA